MSGADAKLTFSTIGAAAIKRARGLEEGGRVQRYIDSEAIRLMSAYTPKDNGTLIDSATTMTKVGSGEILQGGTKAPYGYQWYYNEANFTGSPIRGTHWFERAMKNGGAKSILKGAIREAGAKK